MGHHFQAFGREEHGAVGIAEPGASSGAQRKLLGDCRRFGRRVELAKGGGQAVGFEVVTGGGRLFERGTALRRNEVARAFEVHGLRVAGAA